MPAAHLPGLCLLLSSQLRCCAVHQLCCWVMALLCWLASDISLPVCTYSWKVRCTVELKLATHARVSGALPPYLPIGKGGCRAVVADCWQETEPQLVTTFLFDLGPYGS